MAETLIQLTIDDRPVSVVAGSTIIQAAASLGIDIPTLCYLEGLPHQTSCMICMVEDVNSHRLVPACSAQVSEGMQIVTHNERVREFRRDTLDLLLSEHVGDCEAPCQRTCPALMNIPLMIRQIQGQDWLGAIRTVKQDIALPAVLGRICPAPCEKACTRGKHDQSLSICLLKRFVADIDLASASPYRPICAPDSGKKVAVIGAGPAGLAAAYYLRQLGHAVTVYDKNSLPGGNLRYAVSPEILPASVLDAEIHQITVLGVSFEMSAELGRNLFVDQLDKSFDAVVLTMGKSDPTPLASTGLSFGRRGLQVDHRTFVTSQSGIFAGGSLVAESRMAVRAVGHGKAIAISVDQYLTGAPLVGRHSRFNSVMGRLLEDETQEFLKSARPDDRLTPSGGEGAGFVDIEATTEAGRCLHCDCLKPSSCKLRLYADEYGAHQNRYKIGSRNRFSREVQHELVIYEAGKCIKCGLCVEITRREKERFGFTFIGRGFKVRAAIPFEEALDRGLEKTAAACAAACPTGAISMKASEESLLQERPNQEKK